MSSKRQKSVGVYLTKKMIQKPWLYSINLKQQPAKSLIEYISTMSKIDRVRKCVVNDDEKIGI